MDHQTNYIVFLCYGNKGVFYECAYSLLSLSRLYKPAELDNLEICIYTDDPSWFRSFRDCPLPLHYREINRAILDEWRGKINFVHRVKIEALKDFTKDRTGNILYTDTDTVFTHRLEPLFDGLNNRKLYMHIMEGIVEDSGNPVLKKLNNYLKKNRREKTNGKAMHEMAMWNAGVLGFNTRYKEVLDEVLAFTDKEYSQFPKHIMEQFAFSVAFQQEGFVKAAAPFIFHYWKLKEARQMLASFFEAFKDKSWEQLTHYSTIIQMPALMQEKVDFFHNRSLSASLLRKQWQPAKQNWAELVKQL